MYQDLSKELERKLTADEWDLVSYYIRKADDLGEAGKEDAAKKEIENALAIAASQEDEATREDTIARLNRQKSEYVRNEYVIYTGREAVPEVISLRDTFFHGVADTIDLRARVITAETEDIIGQYILFCRVLDAQVRRFGPTKEAADEAIRICQNRGVMADYLEDRKKEVMDIMIMLFDQEYAVEQCLKEQARESEQKGIQKGIQKGMLRTLFSLVQEKLLPVSIAAKKADMTESEFLSLMNQQETEEDDE